MGGKRRANRLSGAVMARRQTRSADWGFPRWRGGLMHYADSLGVAAIVEQLEILAQEDPVAWKVSPLLRRCAEAGQSLAEARPKL